MLTKNIHIYMYKSTDYNLEVLSCSVSNISSTGELAIFCLVSSMTLIYRLAFCRVISCMKTCLSSFTLFLKGKIERHPKCLFYVFIVHLG